MKPAESSPNLCVAKAPPQSGWVPLFNGKDLSIVKVHLKDFKRKENGYEWVNLGDGDVDWAAVRDAFCEIAYSGSAICELKGGDEAYLRDVSRRVDRLVLGKA